MATKLDFVLHLRAQAAVSSSQGAHQQVMHNIHLAWNNAQVALCTCQLYFLYMSAVMLVNFNGNLKFFGTATSWKYVGHSRVVNHNKDFQRSTCLCEDETMR